MGRKDGPRKTPFSGKAKKQQLKAKKNSKRNKAAAASDATDSAAGGGGGGDGATESKQAAAAGVAVVGAFGGVSGSGAVGTPLTSLFGKETSEQVALRRERGNQPLRRMLRPGVVGASAGAGGDARGGPVAAAAGGSGGGSGVGGVGDTGDDNDSLFPGDNGRRRRKGKKKSKGSKKAREPVCLSWPASSLPDWKFLPHPRRPEWREGTSKEALDASETAAFDAWAAETLEQSRAAAGADGIGACSGEMTPYFELNLEVWRQLWRVIERSDCLVIAADVRLPTFHLPLPLIGELLTLAQPGGGTRSGGGSAAAAAPAMMKNKRVVVVLTKIDLVPGSVVRRWQQYLTESLPGLAAVETFSARGITPSYSSYSSSSADEAAAAADSGVLSRRKQLRKAGFPKRDDPRIKSQVRRILEACGVTARDDTGSIGGGGGQEDDADTEGNDEDAKEGSAAEAGEGTSAAGVLGAAAGADTVAPADATTSSLPGSRGRVTIGLIGVPNAGKTTLLNAMVGQKVASESATPGHTKHLQTIELGDVDGFDVGLCDSPGIVFPIAGVAREMYELWGLRAVAQIREYMSAVRFLGERLPLETLYGLQRPDWLEDDPDLDDWTPAALCDALATKLNFVVDRRGYPDIHRAGQSIMRDFLEGALLLYFTPPPREQQPEVGKAEAREGSQRQEGKDCEGRDTAAAAADHSGGDEHGAGGRPALP